MKSSFNLSSLGLGELAPPDRHEINAEIRRQNPNANLDSLNTPSNGIQWLFRGGNMPESASDRDNWVIVSPYKIEFADPSKDEDPKC